MNIAICDDEPVHLRHIETLVQKWSERNGENVCIRLYSSAQSLLFHYTPGFFDVFLLDIQMDGENGISLAKRLRSCKDTAAIVFITAISDYVFDGYDVGAVQYLLKPVDEKKLFDCLQTAKEKPPAPDRLLFDAEAESVLLSEDEILYFEACMHKTKIVLSERSYFTNESFSAVAQRLPDCFFQCHRSYIVNLKRLSAIKKYEAVLDNGACVPVSRRIYRDFNQAFIAFYKR